MAPALQHRALGHDKHVQGQLIRHRKVDGKPPCALDCSIHRRSTISRSPSSAATLPADRPPVATRSTASRLKIPENLARRTHQARLLSSEQPPPGVHWVEGGSIVTSMAIG
jgi:hypothetical protein